MRELYRLMQKCHALAMMFGFKPRMSSIVDSSLKAQAMWSIAPAICVSDFFDLDGIPCMSPATAINPLVNRYQTKDGRWIQLIFRQPDRFWAGFHRRVGLEGLAADERFVPVRNLIANVGDATAMVADVFTEHDLDRWRNVLRRRRDPVTAAHLRRQGLGHPASERGSLRA